LDWFRRQKEQFERRVNRFEKEKEQFLKEKKEFLSSKEKHQISKKENKRVSKNLEEYVLSLGKFIILNYKEDDNDIDILSFYGIGSSYGLILIDPIRKVCCMSHILFAKPKKSKKQSQIDNPHQYASLCVPHLLKKMLLKGASEKNISAMIFGGAQIFNKNYKSIREVYSILKNELAYYNINIKTADIGGQTQRAIKYNLKEKELFLKYKGEEEFTKL
jgi:chemotaxis receptor (MCP) glutamine deamidase CheD